MNGMKRAAISKWLDTVDNPSDSKNAGENINFIDTHLPVTPPATSPTEAFLRTKKPCTERDFSMTSISSPSLTRSAASVTPTSSSRRQRTIYPYRVRASLTSTTPRITYLHESSEPITDAAKEVLAYLVEDDNTWEPAEEDIAKLLQASRKCTVDMCNAGSWLIDSVRPLLRTAVDNLPLEFGVCKQIQLTPNTIPNPSPAMAVIGKLILL